MLRKLPFVAFLVFGLVSLLSSAPLPEPRPSGTEWPQWQGPKRDNVSADKNLLKEWPKDGPELLWTATGAGRGYSTVAISGGKFYTMGDGLSTADDKDEYLSCFNEADGKQVWKAKLGPAWNSGNESWQSSRSTPTLDGELLYIITPHGNLVCLETAEGKERWRKDLRKDFGGDKADGWGYSESPLVDGDKLVCTPGKAKNTMVALNKKNGETIWSTSSKDDRGAGHSSIVIAEINKTRVYVQVTGSGPMGVRADDGKLLWNYPIDKTTAVIPTPLIKGDLVFFSAGYGRGGALLKQVPTDDGIKVEEVYGLQKDIANKHGGITRVGDRVFGDKEDSGNPWCADLMTGKVLWKKTKSEGGGSASMTYADGHLYVHYANGVMVLLEDNADAYKEVGSFKLPHSGGRPDWSHPVVAGGKLFVREGDFIMCYDVRQK